MGVVVAVPDRRQLDLPPRSLIFLDATQAPRRDQLEVPMTGGWCGWVGWVWARVWSQPVSCSAGKGLLMW
jgi:hypothetical protein